MWDNARNLDYFHFFLGKPIGEYRMGLIMETKKGPLLEFQFEICWVPCIEVTWWEIGNPIL